ncbi:Gfo/Idh/MocA family protein [Phycisphaera mikurensis]|uniref:Putative oxidoreductase n=1 Tax=Phycisphaera mikurensis (strain NBRC 102666 / KCTC 22515 / FYK2301M01) TaxID=1142394 RepID=I0ID65_PHYMF|nr:Gfo/Idh/MocA family oxidoreductase [Phycisphaera mikurensis]MBB6442328.1 putative dehydrogenase [Phycisphaera mikurensis]BAM03203.1 putative oxidoreductase [Phycisphaera mikurensis NBRC 102666]
MPAADGATYAPTGKPNPVLRDGETFPIAAVAFDHGHIHGQINGLIEAGATLRWVFSEPEHAEQAGAVAEKHGARVADTLEQVLEDPAVRLVAAAAVPSERAALGIRCMEAGKDYFTDKTPLTTLEQLDAVRAAVERTGKKYAVYFSERLHVECAMHAGTLIEQGAIGRVIHVTGFGPHRLGDPASRPDWFYQRAKYGGILTDIGSHQIEQFLHYAGCKDARVQASKIGNYNHPDQPELDDFGDCTLVGDNGATMYFRVDWFTPTGLRAWGDGRTFIVGTEGTIELRKYVDLAKPDLVGDVLLLANRDGEQRMELAGEVGFPFFGRLIRDCLDRTENAMTQAHALKAAELCVRAQMQAEKVAG